LRVVLGGNAECKERKKIVLASEVSWLSGSGISATEGGKCHAAVKHGNICKTGTKGKRKRGTEEGTRKKEWMKAEKEGEREKEMRKKKKERCWISKSTITKTSKEKEKEKKFNFHDTLSLCMGDETQLIFESFLFAINELLRYRRKIEASESIAIGQRLCGGAEETNARRVTPRPR
jgi:hypothetical protein